MNPCIVPGCSKPILCREVCNAHYHRLVRYGFPEGGRPPMKRASDTLADLMLLETDDCIMWPRSRDTSGYGRVSIDGKIRPTHVVVCERVKGPRPTPSHQVAHNCGHPLCVNPRHLRWATVTENQADRLIHGTHQRGERSPKARLTAVQVLDIRSRIGGSTTMADLALEFNVARATIAAISQRRSWAWLDPDTYISPPPAA